MSIGFRKSFLGFNCDDVINYVQDSHKKYADTERKLNGKIDDLNGEIDTLNTKIAEITKERNLISAKLKEYEDKCEEIERLSQNIGKLYLVANSNAKAIMKNSAENCAAANNEIENNLLAVSNAQNSLNAVKAELNELNQNFASRIDELTQELNDARNQIVQKQEENVRLSNEFDAVVSSIQK